MIHASFCMRRKESEVMFVYGLFILLLASIQGMLCSFSHAFLGNCIENVLTLTISIFSYAGCNIFLICCISGTLAYYLFFQHARQIDYYITTTWDCGPIYHHPIQISLSWNPKNDFITTKFRSPFFNKDAKPDGPAGQPFPKLWEHEGNIFKT